jgi:uncharacterized Zn finger protein (UPF0148 family)
MSDLLLKGATMTNKHCNECGSPIFRHEGQEFCPNCQTAIAGEGEPEGDAGGREEGDVERQPPGAADANGIAPETEGTAPEESVAGGEGEPEPVPESDPDQPSQLDQPPRTDQPTGSEPTPGTAQVGASDHDHPTVSPEESTAQLGVDRRGESATEAETPTDASPTEAGDLREAHAALRQTLTRFATRAAETDDPRQAREYLVAAREAAEALAALRR